MNLDDLPDVEFAQKDIETILNDMISDFEEAYLQQTGEEITLYPGDKIRIFLYSQALREFQLREIIDFSAKQNLLKYASGDYLDNLGTPFVERLQAQYAIVTEKFTLSAPQPTIQTIPAGTRVTSGNNIYFATTEDIEIPSGSTDITVAMKCTTSGTSGNNLTPGQINILSDPLPWIASVTNASTSQGGVDLESDDDFRDRIRQAPESFSVAGPEGAYIFFAKEYNSSVSDVKVTSPSAGEVDIRILLQNGVIPDSIFLQGINDFLSDKTRRPLTDHVTVSAPDIVNYDIGLTYYILASDATSEDTIKANVLKAVQDYVVWQKGKIGRDINPSELISQIISAGAKRVNVTTPVYTAISDTQVAVASASISVTYGGLESD